MSKPEQPEDEKILVRSNSSPESFHRRTTVIVGLGNPILGDDGIGWHVAEGVNAHLFRYPLPDQDVKVECLSLGGLSLMERLINCDRAILVDAIDTGNNPLGSVHRYSLEDLPDKSGGHLTAAHDTSLQTALRLGRSMGANLPDDIMVVGIESPYVYDFSEELSPAVAAALPAAVKTVLDLLYKDRQDLSKE
jgi:hydrogenase maturation protease